MKNLKMYLGLIAFSLLISISSCDDNEPVLQPTTVKGQVLEYGTNTPIPYAKVRLLRQEAIWGGGGSTSVYDTLSTNVNGFYEITFPESANYIYMFDAIKDGYYELVNPKDDFLPNRENNMNIILDPLAWLKIHVKNVNPFNDQDYMNINGIVNYGPWYGRNIDEAFIKEARGNHENKLVWFITKDNVNTNHQELIYVPKGDTTLFELFY